jgi:hypothetical protein
MKGTERLIGDRPTYFPPFVNERFGKPPYWACTFASLLNGANVGFRGAQEASEREIRALAKASGDPFRRDGSRSSHMLIAMRDRYRQPMRLRRLPPDRVRDRLAHGWAMVAGVTYGDLPREYRIGSFMDGHRVVVLGWQRDQTWLLDPLEDKGPDYQGRPIAWSDFERAWWSSEQLWFRDGMFLPQPTYGPPEALPTPRAWSVRAGVELDLYSPVRAGVVARRITPDSRLRGMADLRIAQLPPPGSHGTPVAARLRIADGPFRGYYLDPTAEGVQAEIADLAPLSLPAAGLPQQPAAAAAAAPADPFRAGRQAEWDRIKKAVGPAVILPERPG